MLFSAENVCFCVYRGNQQYTIISSKFDYFLSTINTQSFVWFWTCNEAKFTYKERFSTSNGENVLIHFDFHIANLDPMKEF
jgi:hypothetical protein